MLTPTKALIANSRRLRALLFPLFRWLNPGDVTVRHHHTSDPLRLHSFRHRGYWWHGREREAESMAVFRALVREGATAFDVGTHIGYVSLLFSRLVGPTGRVVSFEPGENNLPYTRTNLGPRPNVTLIEKAVGPRSGTASFYLEDLTGQNNSLVEHYEGLDATARTSVRPEVREVTVPMTSVDDYVAESGRVPDFIKVDVEGFELGVLEGARHTLQTRRPMLMVEVGSNATAEVFQLMRELGYAGYRPDGVLVRTDADRVENTFFLHPESHAAALATLRWAPPPVVAAA